MLTTESGRVSRTILLHLVLGIACQALALFGWLASVLSTEAWAVVAGVLGTVQAIAGIYERLLAGQPASADLGVRGEPMATRKPPTGPTGLVGVVLTVLMLAACAGHRVELRPPDGGLVLTDDGLAVCYDAGVYVETVATFEGHRLALTGDGTLRLCGALPPPEPPTP